MENNKNVSELDIFGDDFDIFLISLEKKYGVVSECIREANNEMKCLYCQDSYMKDVFNFFPDRLCVDVTYKYADVFMYILLCEDSNGRNEVIALAFTRSDSPDSFLWILNTFKKHNPNWRRTKLLTLDPEIKYKDIVRNIFPTPYVIICFHHALKSFTNGMESIKIQNMIPNDQVKFAIDLFKSLYNSITHAEYDMFYQQFIMLHSSLVFYFQDVWVPLQPLWRIGIDFFHENLFSSLNYHLENIDKTIKVIFISEANLMKFIEKLFVILSIKRKEKSNVISLTNPSYYSRFSTEYQISRILTPYSARFVVDQYGLSSEIHIDCTILSDSYFFDNLGTTVNTTASMCQCNFYLYFFLPCRHIFAVRKTLNICPFDENLVDSAWIMKYYQSSYLSIQTTLKGMNINVDSEHVQNLLELSLLSLYEDFHITEPQSELLNELVRSWKNNMDVCIHFEGVESNERFLIESQILKTESPQIRTPVSIKTGCEFIQIRTPSKSMNEGYAELTPALSKSLRVGDTFKKRAPSKPFKVGCSAENSLSLSSPPCEKDSNQRKWNFKSKLLDGTHINYAYLCRIICESKESIIDWLRQMELICTSMLCPTCGCAMSLKLVPRLSDGAVWVCSNDMDKKQSCSRRCSVRRGSWFELTNMSFEQILTFCYMWINGFSQVQIISETGISTATYISWNKLNRRVCEECLMENSSYSCMNRMDSNHLVLESWLEKRSNEDTFLKFLQDANAMHRKDSAKHSVW